jgi:DNA-binding IclR family transcriptional regulator
MGDVPRANGDFGDPGVPVEPDTASYAGAQSISRAFQVMRCVARAGADGLRLRDAVAQLGLNSSTAHRLLMALANERVIVHDPLRRRYRIGTEFLHLIEAARDADLTRHYGDVVRYIAAKTGESTYLSVPSGTDVLCIARVLGASVIQPIPFDVGGRRPFGVGVAGIVALAAMPEHRIASILARHAPAFQDYGLTADDIAPLVGECREKGFSYNPGLFIKGVSGLGVPIMGTSGTMVGILSIVAIDERLRSEGYRMQLVKLMNSAISNTDGL